MVNRWEGLSEPFPGLFASSLSLHNNHVGHWHWDLEEEVACPTSEPTISAVTYIQVVPNACFFPTTVAIPRTEVWASVS